MRDAELEMLARLAKDMEAYDMEEDGMAGQYGMEGAGVVERKIDLYAALGVEEDADLDAIKKVRRSVHDAPARSATPRVNKIV